MYIKVRERERERERVINNNNNNNNNIFTSLKPGYSAEQIGVSESHHKVKMTIHKNTNDRINKSQR